MNFEQEIVRLQDTLVVVAEIQRRQAEVQKMQGEGWALHEQRMAHVLSTPSLPTMLSWA